MKEESIAKIEEAGRKVVEFKNRGFHCSESVFMAVNEILKITDTSMLRIVTGFHGGGGTHRLEPGIDLNAVLEGVASGRDRRPSEELPITQIGHLCGAVASGIVCIGLIYGRKSPSDDLTCVDELCYELHRRFMEEFGENECRPIREKWVPQSSNQTCEYVYKRGAEIIVELILKAPQLVPECQKFNNC